MNYIIFIMSFIVGFIIFFLSMYFFCIKGDSEEQKNKKLIIKEYVRLKMIDQRQENLEKRIELYRSLIEKADYNAHVVSTTTSHCVALYKRGAVIPVSELLYDKRVFVFGGKDTAEALTNAWKWVRDNHEATD